VGHHIALSVVGTERMLESGYFRAKMAQENLIQASSVPYTIVRVTQFFEFVKTIADFATAGSQVRLPPVLFQPIAADDVAAALAKFVTSPPIKGMIEIGGPDRSRLDAIARQELAALQDPREVISDPDARYYGIAVSETTLVPDEGAQLGETHFETWLRDAVKQLPKESVHAA
jgi:uncharacterized protein YbjT (DUF2867 family)